MSPSREPPRLPVRGTTSADRNAKPQATLAISRAEWIWLLAAIALGAILRLAYPGRMAVEHFDEGVYASNVLFGAEANYQYPGREFFAPPLLPTVIEWLHIAWSLTGLPTPGWLPMVPALICGIATIPSLWWIARKWFGPDAGIVAAWLIACCEFHAAYSRTALTDVPLAFFLAWAVYWFTRAHESGSIRHAIIAGVFTAAAWWTKYNGWLPLAITATACVLQMVLAIVKPPAREGEALAEPLPSLLVLFRGTLTAGVLWLPVLWDCQDVGGYAAVAANHRGYVEGWSAWWRNALLQYGQHSGEYLGMIFGVTFAVLFVSALRPTTFWLMKVYVFGIVMIAVYLPTLGVPMLLLGAVVLGFRGFVQTVGAGETNRLISLAHLGVWLVSLFVVTPLYHTYPRLMLPLHLVTLLTVGSLLTVCSSKLVFQWESQGAIWAALPILMVMGMGMGTHLVWEDHAAYRRAAQFIAADRNAGPWDDASKPSLVYVVNEPAFFYHLRQAGVPAATVGDFSFVANAPAGVAVYFAAGPLFDATPERRDDWQRLQPQFTEVTTFGPRCLSMLVRLDQDADLAKRLAEDDDFARYRLFQLDR